MACGESAAPTATVAAAQVGDARDADVGAHDDDERQIAVGVAHRDRPRAAVRAAAARRTAAIQASGEFHATWIRPARSVLDLALVVRVEHVVEVEAVRGEPRAGSPSQIVTTFGSYATAPSRNVVSLATVARSEQRQAADGLADEVVERVGGRRHDPRGARVAEAALDAELLAERRAAAHAHREVGDLGCAPRRRRPCPRARAASRRRGRCSSAASVSARSARARVGLDPHPREVERADRAARRASSRGARSCVVGDVRGRLGDQRAPSARR